MPWNDEITSIGTAAGAVVALVAAGLGWRSARHANRTAERALDEARRSNEIAEQALATQQEHVALERAGKQSDIKIERISARSNSTGKALTCTLRNIGGSAGTLTNCRVTQGGQDQVVGTSQAVVHLAPGDTNDVHFLLSAAVPGDWNWAQSGCTVLADLVDAMGQRTLTITHHTGT